MFDISMQFLVEFTKLLLPCVFLRIVLDATRNYIFKN